MKIKDDDELAWLLSYEPSKELRIMVLDEVKRTGKSIAEIADKYAMPPLIFPKTEDPDEVFEISGRKMTLPEFEKNYPFKRIVVIRKHKTV